MIRKIMLSLAFLMRNINQETLSFKFELKLCKIKDMNT